MKTVQRENRLTPDLLRRAAVLMSEVGLNKGDFWPRAGDESGDLDYIPRPYKCGQPVCAWGAIYVAAGWADTEALKIPEFENWNAAGDLTTPNDLPGTTTEEMVALLKHEADLLESQGSPA